MCDETGASAQTAQLLPPDQLGTLPLQVLAIGNEWQQGDEHKTEEPNGFELDRLLRDSVAMDTAHTDSP